MRSGIASRRVVPGIARACLAVAAASRAAALSCFASHVKQRLRTTAARRMFPVPWRARRTCSAPVDDASQLEAQVSPAMEGGRGQRLETVRVYDVDPRLVLVRD